MKIGCRAPLAVALSFIVVVLGVGIGSVFVPPMDVLKIITFKVIGQGSLADVNGSSASIVWDIRLPRVLLAYLVGAALSVSGAVMQSVLKNPLASSYTLGVSSGASFGAALIIVSGFRLHILGSFTLPVTGLLFGVMTVVIAISLASRLDSSMENNTIILVGIVFSLFINAILTLITTLFRDKVAQITFWQMGSFALKEWSSIGILLPIITVLTVILLFYTKEMDILTFGEEQALSIGVDVQRVKWILLGLSAALTGSAISFVGVIGFIDLVAPFIVRKLYGSAHEIVLPMTAVFGGSFMVVCDLAARTIISPYEIPVGAVTAMVGAPFFTYLYFSKRRVQHAGN